MRVSQAEIDYVAEGRSAALLGMVICVPVFLIEFVWFFETMLFLCKQTTKRKHWCAFVPCLR